jgi:hypothetical protein
MQGEIAGTYDSIAVVPSDIRQNHAIHAETGASVAPQSRERILTASVQRLMQCLDDGIGHLYRMMYFAPSPASQRKYQATASWLEGVKRTWTEVARNPALNTET